MNRKIMAFVVGLLALGALEFGLLGASASGIVGGSGDRLPPIVDRGNVPATGTATATATATPYPTSTASPTPQPNAPCTTSPPESGPFCSAVAASIELLRPEPAAIHCNGAASSYLRVVVRNKFGNPVDDGTPVKFWVFNGSASPGYAQTVGGAAATSIVIYSDAYSQQPNVVVRAGDMETAIRVRCIPNSDCLVSPPDNSPPCRTPFPCNPSPGADINSPPCVVETPVSPPICAPGQTSPPCVTPTSTPNLCAPSPARGEISPPCATATPLPWCAPYVPSLPPCAEPSATPTPPGADAQTATAIASQTATGGIGGPPAATDTPTAVPTTTRTPQRTSSPAPQRTSTPVSSVCADVTGDGRVTSRDVTAITAHMFGRYRARYDLNGDRHVNRQDVQIAISQLGRRC